jgi:hypothetical protein
MAIRTFTAIVREVPQSLREGLRRPRRVVGLFQARSMLMAALWSRSITKPESRTHMGTFLERFGNQLTASAAVLARVIGVHQHHLSPGACSLGDTEGLEGSPASI